VSWGIIVINWLTIGSAEAEANITTLMTQKTIPSAERPLELRTASWSREGSVMTSVEVPVFIQQPSCAYMVRTDSEPGKSAEDVIRPLRVV
jgi:hypothetical protein